MHNPRPRICFLIGGSEGGGNARSTLQLIERIDRGRFDVSVVADCSAMSTCGTRLAVQVISCAARDLI